MMETVMRIPARWHPGMGWYPFHFLVPFVDRVISDQKVETR
jgi:hypothetical protein